MKFHKKKWQKLNKILVKIGILQEAPFSMTERHIENPGKEYRHNIPWSSYMKFYPIRSRGWGEMASNGRTEGRGGDYMLALRGA